MNAQDALMNQKTSSVFKDVLSLGLYAVGIGAGALGGLVILLLVA